MEKTFPKKFSPSLFFKNKKITDTEMCPLLICHMLCKLRKSEIFFNGLGCFFSSDGRSDNTVNAEFVCQRANRGYQLFKSFDVIVADLQRGIDEEVSYVMVACENACNESLRDWRPILNILFKFMELTPPCLGLKVMGINRILLRCLVNSTVKRTLARKKFSGT